MSTTLQQQAADIKKQFLLPISQNEALQMRQYQEGNRPRFDGEYQRDYTRIIICVLFPASAGENAALCGTVGSVYS